MSQEPGSYSGEPGNNIFEEIQKSGSTSNPSSQFLTQERALAAISPQTGSVPTGNVSVGGNTFPARTSPYMETAGSQGFQEFAGTAGNAATKLAVVLPAFTGVGAPVTAAATGVLGPGLAATTAGFTLGGAAATGVGMGYDYLTGPGGITGQSAYQRMDESGASLAGEIAPIFTAMVPFGAGAWNATNIGGAAIAGGINAVAREGIYNATASTDETLKNIGLETAMGAGFGAMRPTAIGQALAQPGINAGLNNPLYRGAVRNMIFDGATTPTINNGAINGVPLQQPGGTATAYDPVSGTGRVLFRNPDGTVSTANYTNLEGQAAKLSGAHTAGMPYAGTEAPDFYASVYGRPNVGPNPQKEGPIDVEATQAGPTARLKAPEWGETGDVGKPDGRKPIFGQDQQAPGPKESPKPAVEPTATTTETAPSVRTATSDQNVPAAPKPVRYGIPENPDQEWFKEPGNREKWDKYYRDYKAWRDQYGKTHFLDGTPMPPEYVEGTPEYAARQAREKAQREAAAQQQPPATETPAPATPTAATETTAPTATTEPAAPAPTTTAPTVTAETPATAVAGVETPTAPKPTVATAERPPVWTPPEVAGTGPKPAVIGQTGTSGNDVATTGSPVGEPASGGAGGGASAAGKPPVGVAETVVSIPGDTLAPVIPDRKKEATKEDILAGRRGMDEASPGVEASFTNDERKQYFDNRAKYLLTSDPSTLSEKDIRERASLVGSSKPSVSSTNATYTGPKLPAFVTTGLTAGKTIDEVFKDVPETQKAEFTSWLRDFKIWMDTISHDNKTPAQIATTSTPQSIATQNQAIADAGYTPRENQITRDIQAGGQIVAVSDYNNATYDKAQLNHDENTYIRHPQTKKVVSVQMPNGDINHYEVAGPLFVNGLVRDEAGNIVSDDPVGLHEANISGKPMPVGTPTVLQFTPNAATSVNPIEASRLLPRHTDKIPAAQTAAPQATPVAPAPVAPAPAPTAISEPAQEQPSARFEDTFERRGGKYPGPDNYFYAKDKSALVVRNTDGSLTLYKGIQPDGNNRLWTYKNEKELMDGYKGMLDKAEKASEPTKAKPAATEQPVATEQPAPAAAEQPSKKEEYRGQHKAPTGKNGEGSLDAMDRTYPDDIYSSKGARYYGSGDAQMDKRAHDLIVSLRGKPDEMVTVYRAVPKGVSGGINTGDWVTPIREYAISHGERFEEGFNILEKTVRAGDLFTEGNSIFEFGLGESTVETKPKGSGYTTDIEVSDTPSEKAMDEQVAAADAAESQAKPPNESVSDAWKEESKNKETQKPITSTPSTDAVPSAVKQGKRYKNFSASITVKDGVIKFGGRGEVTTKVSDFDPQWQTLLNSYASDDAEPMRSGAFPAFFDNSEAGGAGSWITAPVPMSNGNFLIYEVNPYGKKPEGNARNRTVRLFRYVVNSSGVQLLQPFEVGKNELSGFKSNDGKYAIPALLHAMIVAADDYTKSKSMSVDEVLEVSGGRVPLTGIIDSQLRDYEDNGIAPVGIRLRMEEFNALQLGLSINNAIIVFMGDPSNNDNAKVLAYELEFNANLSKEQAKKFVRDIVEAQGGDQSLINFNVVREPLDDMSWPGEGPSGTLQGITNKRGAKIFEEWLKRGRKALVTEVGTDDPATGLPMPKEIQKPGLNPQGKPWTKVKKKADGTPELDADGNPATEPWMVPNPKRWLIEYPDFVNEETFHVKDAQGKTIFKPMPYQVRGMNAALGRFLRDSTPVKTGEVARAFLNMDAPGLGKTIQILGTAKMWHEKMKVWTKDPNSPWFGKPAKVLVVSQNRTILKNAFGGDAAKMGLDLGGQFVTVGGHTKFVPNKTTGTDEGGISIDGEESWIDFATYSDIKPQVERVPIWLDESKKVPKMVPLYKEKDGELVIGADGQPIIEQEPDGKGGTKDKYVQAHEEIPSGPPKKGAGEWGLVVFDECHNMKNMDSGRSQAGHDLFIRSQHVMLATGTPIDKPHLLGYFIAMVLDVSLHDIAPELQMKVEGSRMSKTRKAKGFTAQDFRDSLSIKHWAKLSPEQQQEVFLLALLGIRRIRDRAGNMGRLIRRGKAFFGIPDLWFDCTDSMTPEAKEMIIKHEIWWAAHIASLPPAARRNQIGQKLMESKRLAACIKLGVPNTRFNSTSEPKGATRFLLNEIKNNRKVIITIDTTNEDGEIDPNLKGKFKGLPGPNGLPSTYDSEFVMLKKYLDSLGIKYGTIVGADIAGREQSIADFQKNNADVPVIIMTIASGGTGLSLQDLFNQAREWGYDRKTGAPKIELGEEYDASVGKQPSEGRKFVSGAGKEGLLPPLPTATTGEKVRRYLSRTADENMSTYDKPIPTDSFPRSMIIVSAPWGGDSVEQVIGRADRMNTTTPTRVFWMTTEIASGDKRLIELVRAKIATLESMIKYGDDLDALIAGGIEAEGVRPTPAQQSGQSKKLPRDAAKALAKSALESVLAGEQAIKDNNEAKIEGILANDPELSNPANKRKVQRWRSAIKKATASIDSIKVALEELESGALDPYSVDPTKIKVWLQRRGLTPTGDNPDETDVDPSDDEEGESMDNVYRNIINRNVITNKNGIAMIVPPGGTKASRNRLSNIIQNLYGLQSGIVPETARPEITENVQRVINDIVRPYRAAYANGEINARRFAAILGFATDVAWRLTDYDIGSLYVSDDDTGRKLIKMEASGAINIYAKELMTLIFSEGTSRNLFGKSRMSAKDSMYTTFHEVGHALMAMIPDDIKAGMFKELEAARASWFASLPAGDVRTALQMPEYDWHFTGGIRNYSFSMGQTTGRPLGDWSSSEKTYTAPKYVKGRLVSNFHKNDAKFLASPLVAMALHAFAENGGRATQDQKKTLRSIFEIETSGVGRDGQLGFKAGSGAIAPFMSLFNLGLGGLLDQMQGTEFAPATAPVIEQWTEGQDGSMQLVKGGKSSLTMNDIQGMVEGGMGYITADMNNSRFVTIRTISGFTKRISSYTIDAHSMIEAFLPKFSAKYNRADDTRKLSGMGTGSILREFIYGATDDAFMRQRVSGVKKQEDVNETRIYRLMNIDEWLAENTAAYCRDYYMLGNYSSEVSMAGDIVASLFVHASSGGDAKTTRRIISNILGNTLPLPKGASVSGLDYYSRYGSDHDKAIRDGAQQSGSSSPPGDDMNVLRNILPRGMSVTEESILKSGRAAEFSATAVRTVKQWALNMQELKQWAIDTAANMVPSSKNLAKLQKDISRRAAGAKAIAKAPLTYGVEGLIGTLIGQIEQIGRITNNDMVRELGKRLYTRPDSGEFNRDTFTEDMTVWRNYWQAIFNRIVEKHLSSKIKNSSEARDRYLSLQKGFNVNNNKATVKSALADALTQYVLNVVHPEYNKMVRARREAIAYINEDKWDSIPQDLKAYLEELGITGPSQITKLRGLIAQTEIDVASETAKFGSGGKYDNIKFGREADAYLGDFFEDGTIDKLLMDVGRCMAVSRNRKDYNTYISSKFSPDIIACANELVDEWARPYREWAKSMGKEIDDWGTSWRPRVMDSDAIHGIRGGVRNRSDAFILKAAETIYMDNKHQRVLLPREFKQFFEDNDYFIQLGVDFSKPNPSKSLHGITQAFTESELWRQDYEKGILPEFLMKRIGRILQLSRDTEMQTIDYGSEFGFDIDNDTRSAKVKHKTKPGDDDTVLTTRAVSVAIALKAYRRLLDVVLDNATGPALNHEKEMIDKAIERLDEQNNRKKIEQDLTMVDAFKLARKFSDRVLHKSLGLASSGSGYSDIFGGQFGNLNNADSLQQRLMECEFADNYLSEFYVNDVRIFGKHYNDSVTRTILIRHHIPESFWNALQKSVVSNPDSTHYWPDLCWCVRRITESDQEEGSSGLVTSMMTLGAHSLFMTGTSALQFAEPLGAGAVFKPEGPIKSAVLSSKAAGGNLRMVLTSLVNTLTSATTQMVTVGNVNPQSAPGLSSITKEDEFYRRLATRVGIVQNRYLEGLDTSTADRRGLLQRMSDLALERFHYSGSGLTAVTDASRVSVMKATIMALEQMADEIITKTRALNPNGMWIRGAELSVITNAERMTLRNLGVKESDISYFLEFCVKYRASITGDYSAMSTDMMEDLIESTTLVTKETEKERFERAKQGLAPRNRIDIIKEETAKRAYFNALARINFSTVQVSSRATEQRVRAALSKVTSAGTARFIFFLTHYTSSFARNIILPAARVFKSSLMGRSRQFNKISPGFHDPSYRLGNIEDGTYADMVANPYAGFRNSARALATLTAVFALMISANYLVRKARAGVRKNPAMTIVDKPSTAMDIAASIDSTGFLGNTSLPFNLVLNGIRFNRSASQVVAGPYPGKVFQAADDIRNAYSPNSRNSPNTPTAERRVAGDIYDIVFIPVATEFLTYVLPRSNMGDMFNLVAIQAMAHPGTKEAFKRSFPGSGEAVPRRKSELDSLYNSNKITFSQYISALRQRQEWEAANPTKVDAVGERERR